MREQLAHNNMATPSAVSSSVLDAPCCYGCVVLTREAGVQLWSGWRAKPSTPVPMKQLCDTVSGMFKEDADGGQDSSFLDAGTFAAGGHGSMGTAQAGFGVGADGP